MSAKILVAAPLGISALHGADVAPAVTLVEAPTDVTSVSQSTKSSSSLFEEAVAERALVTLTFTTSKFPNQPQKTLAEIKVAPWTHELNGKGIVLGQASQSSKSGCK